jgi:hypothetical protein
VIVSIVSDSASFRVSMFQILHAPDARITSRYGDLTGLHSSTEIALPSAVDEKHKRMSPSDEFHRPRESRTDTREEATPSGARDVQVAVGYTNSAKGGVPDSTHCATSNAVDPLDVVALAARDC